MFASASASAARRLAATARHLDPSSAAASASPSSSSVASVPAPSSSSARAPRSNAISIQNVTVFGAGLMGAGIAEVAIQKGFNVVLCDVSEKALEQGKKGIVKSVTKRSKTPEQVLSRLQTTSDPSSAVAKADLVIEAIIENIDIKQKLFATIDKAASPDCILTSNTSSLQITEICSKLGIERRRRFGGLHFFNPVPAMKLVEVVQTPELSSDIFNALYDFSKRLGKVPVACKDTPGFIVNRLLIPYLREAVLMYERGDATAEDIDTAMKLGAGHPMGPLELQDLVGLDTGKAIGDGWRERAEKGDERIPKELVKRSKLLDDLVAAGKLGMKTGEGIRKYKKA